MRTEFFVPGVPLPQGSKTAVLTPQGRLNLLEGKRGRRAAFDAWRQLVKVLARRNVRREPCLGVVDVVLDFTFVRPKTSKRLAPTVRPDLDKLARAVLDALTGVVFEDDSQVCRLDAVKDYGEVPGCLVSVTSCVALPCEACARVERSTSTTASSAAAVGRTTR